MCKARAQWRRISIAPSAEFKFNDDNDDKPMTPEEEELNTATAADEEEQNTTTCTAKIIHDTDVIKTLRARASAQMAGKGVVLWFSLALKFILDLWACTASSCLQFSYQTRIWMPCGFNNKSWDWQDRCISQSCNSVQFRIWMPQQSHHLTQTGRSSHWTVASQIECLSPQYFSMVSCERASQFTEGRSESQ